MPNELVPQTDPVMAMISTAIDKGMDVASLQGLFDMQRQWNKDQALIAFGKAIQGFQAEMPPVIKGNPVKDKVGNLLYSFANYEDVLEIAQPLLTKYGISVTFSTKMAGGLMETTCRVRVGTHFEDTSFTLGLPSIPNANDAQKAGGALSYGQRNSFKAALGIRIKGEDNDAKGLVGYISAEEAAHIDSLMKEVAYFSGQPFQRGPFLNWLVEGLEVVEELPSDKLAQAIMELGRKRQEAIRSKKK